MCPKSIPLSALQLEIKLVRLRFPLCKCLTITNLQMIGSYIKISARLNLLIKPLCVNLKSIEPSFLLISAGEFSWTPTTTDVTSLVFYASDESNVTSSFYVSVQLCACQHNTTCDFDNYQSYNATQRFTVSATSDEKLIPILSCQGFRSKQK